MKIENTNEPVNVLVWNKCSKLKWHGRKQIVMVASSPACSSVVVLKIQLEEEEIIKEFNMQSTGVKKKHKQERLALKMRNALYEKKNSLKLSIYNVGRSTSQLYI